MLEVSLYYHCFWSIVVFGFWWGSYWTKGVLGKCASFVIAIYVNVDTTEKPPHESQIHPPVFIAMFKPHAANEIHYFPKFLKFLLHSLLGLKQTRLQLKTFVSRYKTTVTPVDFRSELHCV